MALNGLNLFVNWDLCHSAERRMSEKQILIYTKQIWNEMQHLAFVPDY